MKLHILAAIAAAGTLAACVPPTRDDAVERTADRACKRYETCGTLDANYGSFNECISAWETLFYAQWSESDCDDGQIDRAQLRECHSSINNFDCDGGILQVWGVLSSSCSAAQVCTN